MFRRIICKIEVVILAGFLLLIRAYQVLISPWMNNHCRFHPSCSTYAKDALERHGIAQGLYFTLRRLLRCHPFHSGGYDPIPEERSKTHGH